jgi:HEAT repeat protein
MPAIQPVILAVGVLLAPAQQAARAPGTDLGHLREMLMDRQNPRAQSQAALLLLQSPDPEAEKVVRQGLQQAEDAEVFQALATGVRGCQDSRFVDELLSALTVNRPGVRQAAAEALAVLPEPAVFRRLREAAEDAHAEPALRQAALWALGRSGRQDAVPILLAQLTGPAEGLRRTAAEGLADLTGQNFGSDAEHWRAWWGGHKGQSNERWLQERLAYQTSRAHRLDGDLERARNQVLRLHQQFYNRLPAAERLGYIQSIVDQEDPAVRALAVVWAVEHLPTADAAKQRGVAAVLLRLSHDGTAEVQRAAVLGLGRVDDPAGFERLQALLVRGRPLVRAAAARSLALLARGDGPDRLKQVLPALQKALEDPAPEVVVEAAEDLGALGAPEAGPVLTGLLHHPAEPVRQAAAQALERVADASVLDRLLEALDDSSFTVRFSVVGAAGRATASGPLPDSQRLRVQARLEGLLLHDADPGVRSRAAMVLGEVGTPGVLQSLWRCAQQGEDARLQEKAWGAFVEVLARSGSAASLQEWDRTLLSQKQGPRRLQLLGELSARWGKLADRKAATAAQELLVQALLEQGKWAAAFPQVRDLLARPAPAEGEVNQRLQWLLTVGEQALREGNRDEALRAVQEAQPFLSHGGPLATGFEKLEKQASAKE